MHGCVHVGVVRWVVAGNQVLARDRLGSLYDAGLSEWRNSGWRKVRQGFARANGNCKASSCARPRCWFNRDIEVLSVGRPCWNTEAHAHGSRPSSIHRNCHWRGTTGLWRVRNHRHHPSTSRRDALDFNDGVGNDPQTARTVRIHLLEVVRVSFRLPEQDLPLRSEMRRGSTSGAHSR